MQVTAKLWSFCGKTYLLDSDKDAYDITPNYKPGDKPVDMTIIYHVGYVVSLGERKLNEWSVWYVIIYIFFSIEVA